MSARAIALKHGFRSGFEKDTADFLKEQGVAVTFEDPAHRIRYVIPERKTYYTPDFPLPNGIIVETKGQFTTADRKKHRLIKQQHPELDIRIVFQNPNAKISKTSKTTYAKWCDDHGIPWAKAPTPAQRAKGAPMIPLEWLNK